MLFVRLKKKNIENLLTTITCVTGIWKYRDFFGGGKPEYPAKNLSEQGREPAINSAHIWNRRWDLNPGHICERRVLSPLRQIQILLYWSITVCDTDLLMKVIFSGRIMKRRTYLLFVATFCMAYCCK